MCFGGLFTDGAAMTGCCIFEDALLSLEFFFRCKLLILSDRVRECVSETPVSALRMLDMGGLFAVVFLGFEFRLHVRRRLLLLRSGL